MQNSCLKTSAWWLRSGQFVENGFPSLRFPNMVKMNIYKHWTRVRRFNPLWVSGTGASVGAPTGTSSKLEVEGVAKAGHLLYNPRHQMVHEVRQKWWGSGLLICPLLNTSSQGRTEWISWLLTIGLGCCSHSNSFWWSGVSSLWMSRRHSWSKTKKQITGQQSPKKTNR